MTVWYLAILMFSMMLSWIVYYNLNYRFTIQKSADLSMQTLYSLKSNFNNLIDNVRYNSTVIMSNSEIQDIIKGANDSDMGVSQRRMSINLALLMNSMPSINSLYVFDNYGNCYGTGRQPSHNIKIDSVKEADWYDKVVALQGGCLLQLHATNILESESEKRHSLLAPYY
jgi:two-component system sensor histidine kinase YesM